MLAAHIAALFAHYGRQHWWPARSRWEVIAGAILVQNTNWSNAEHALQNLRRARSLSLHAMRALPAVELESLLRPSGFFRQKTKTLQRFIAWLDAHHHGSLARMFASPAAALRSQLLTIPGIGPETADSILLYAGGVPTPVISAYARRVISRHALLPKAQPSYDSLQRHLRVSIPPHEVPALLAYLDAGSAPRHAPSPRSPIFSPRSPKSTNRAHSGPLVRFYSELHAVLVAVGRGHCGPRPRCEQCPLRHLLPATIAAAPAELGTIMSAT